MFVKLKSLLAHAHTHYIVPNPITNTLIDPNGTYKNVSHKL